MVERRHRPNRGTSCFDTFSPILDSGEDIKVSERETGIPNLTRRRQIWGLQPVGECG